MGKQSCYRQLFLTPAKRSIPLTGLAKSKNGFTEILAYSVADDRGYFAQFACQSFQRLTSGIRLSWTLRDFLTLSLHFMLEMSTDLAKQCNGLATPLTPEKWILRKRFKELPTLWMCWPITTQWCIDIWIVFRLMGFLKDFLMTSLNCTAHHGIEFNHIEFEWAGGRVECSAKKYWNEPF